MNRNKQVKIIQRLELELENRKEEGMNDESDKKFL